MHIKQFDQTIIDKPKIRFLVITDSFADDSKFDSKELSYWIKLQSFFLCEVVFTPTDNEKVKDFFHLENGKLTEYSKYSDEGYALLCEDSSYLASLGNIDFPEDHPLKLNLIACTLARCSAFSSDFIVIQDFGKHAEVLKISKKQNKYINSRDARDLIRVFSIGLKQYFIGLNSEISESYYYLYRFKSIFFEYQLAWSVVCSIGTFMDRKQEILNSLDKRLRFPCMTMDSLEYYALREPSNSTQDQVMYYLTYFVLLSTGSFDSLAWLCQETYSLNFSKNEVTLKENGRRNSFLEAIRSNNPRLGEYLINSDTQKRIKLFYPMRDSFIHRELLKGSRVMGAGFNGNGYQILPETKDRLESIPNFEPYKWGILDGFDGHHVDGHRFSRALFSEFVNLINEILHRMDWEAEARKYNLEDAEQTIAHAKLAKTALWRFFNLREEPMYF